MIEVTDGGGQDALRVEGLFEPAHRRFDVTVHEAAKVDLRRPISEAPQFGHRPRFGFDRACDDVHVNLRDGGLLGAVEIQKIIVFSAVALSIISLRGPSHEGDAPEAE